MNPAEKAALTQGKDILTKEQIAVVYCVVKGWSKELGLKNKDASTWPNLIGLKEETFRHTHNKIFNKLNNTDKFNTNESQKYNSIVEELEQLPKEEALNIAYKSIEIKPVVEKAKVKAKDKKHIENGKIINAISDYVRLIPESKALKVVAAQKGLSMQEITLIWKSRFSI